MNISLNSGFFNAKSINPNYFTAPAPPPPYDFYIDLGITDPAWTTVSGTSIVPSLYGDARNFLSGDYIDTGDSSINITSYDAYTIAFRLRRNVLSGVQYICATWADSSRLTGFGVYLTDNDIAFIGDNAQFIALGGGYPADTDWHSIILTNRGNIGAEYIYVDGVSVFATGYSNNFTQGGALQVGKRIGSTSTWDGDIKEIIIEPHAWTDQEITDYADYVPPVGTFNGTTSSLVLPTIDFISPMTSNILEFDIQILGPLPKRYGIIVGGSDASIALLTVGTSSTYISTNFDDPIITIDGGVPFASSTSDSIALWNMINDGEIHHVRVEHTFNYSYRRNLYFMSNTINNDFGGINGKIWNITEDINNTGSIDHSWVGTEELGYADQIGVEDLIETNITYT